MIQGYNGVPILRQLVDFCVLDLETTGLSPNWDEIIEVCILRVRNGKIADTYHSLVKPIRPIDPFITSITGITNEMVADSPNIEDISDEIRTYIADDVIVGHNISFDIKFLLESSVSIQSNYLDTLRISRKVFPEQPSHSLSYLADALDLEHSPNHRSEDDCIATFLLYEACINRIVEDGIDIENLFKRAPRNRTKPNPDDILQTVDGIDEDSAFWGKVIVFTGALEKMTRVQAWQMVRNLGGIPDDGVTKKTNILVIGDEDYKSEVKSSKRKKAEKIQSDGLEIEIMNETAFLDLIDDSFEKNYYNKY